MDPPPPQPSNDKRSDDPIVNDVILETSSINKLNSNDNPIVIDSQNFDLGINSMEETPCIVETTVEITTTATTTREMNQNDETNNNNENKEATSTNEVNNEDDLLLLSTDNTCQEESQANNEPSPASQQQQQQQQQSKSIEQTEEQQEKDAHLNKTDKTVEAGAGATIDDNTINCNSLPFSPNNYEPIDVDDDDDSSNAVNSKQTKLLTNADPNLNGTKGPITNEVESQVDLNLHLSQSTYISNNSYSIIEQQKQPNDRHNGHHDTDAAAADGDDGDDDVIHDTQEDSVEQMLANQHKNNNNQHQDILTDDVNSNFTRSIRDLEMFVDAVIIDDSCQNEPTISDNNNTIEQQQQQQQQPTPPPPPPTATTTQQEQTTETNGGQEKKRSEIVIRKKLTSIISGASKKTASKTNTNDNDETIVEHFIIKNAIKTGANKTDKTQTRSTRQQSSPEIEQIPIQSNEQSKPKARPGRPPKSPETTTFRVRQVRFVEVVETIREMTYHDIVDKYGNIVHTELVSKITNEKVLSKSEETKLNNARTTLTENNKSVNNSIGRTRTGLRRSGIIYRGTTVVNLEKNNDNEEDKSNNTNTPTTTTRVLRTKSPSPPDTANKLRAINVNPVSGKRVYNKKLFNKKRSAAATTTTTATSASPIEEEEIRQENEAERNIHDNDNEIEESRRRRSSDDMSLTMNYNDNESVFSRNQDGSLQNIETISLTDSCRLRHSTSSHSLNDSNAFSRTTSKTIESLKSQMKECTVVLKKLDIDLNRMPIKLNEGKKLNSYPSRDEHIVVDDSESTSRSRRTSIIELSDDSDSNENNNPNDSFNEFESKFGENDDIFAKWTVDNQYYPAKIVKKHNRTRDFTIKFLEDKTESRLKEKDFLSLFEIKLDHQLMVQNKQSGIYENCTLVKIDSYNLIFDVKLSNNRIISAHMVRIMVPKETASLIYKRKNRSISPDNVIEGKRKRVLSTPFNVSIEKKRRIRSSPETNHKSMSKSNSKSSIRSE